MTRGQFCVLIFSFMNVSIVQAQQTPNESIPFRDIADSARWDSDPPPIVMADASNCSMKSYCPCKARSYSSDTECAVECPSGLKCFGEQCTTPPRCSGQQNPKPSAVDRPCPLPEKYELTVVVAALHALHLANKEKCSSAFRSIVSGLSGKKPSDISLAETVQKLRPALADNCETLLNRLKKAHGTKDLLEPGYSVPNTEYVWLTEKALRLHPTRLACVLIHESSHVAGARADFVAETAIESIHDACNCPRQFPP